MTPWPRQKTRSVYPGIDLGRTRGTGEKLTVRLSIGVHDITLTVTDRDGLSAQSTARVVVLDATRGKKHRR